MTRAQLAALIALALFVLAVITAVQEEETCPNILVVGNRELWEAWPSLAATSVRDDIASFYDLRESDWDGAWGYDGHDEPDAYLNEFGKMMLSGWLLWTGISSTPTLQGDWRDQQIEGRFVRAARRDDDTIDIVFRKPSTGALLHFSISGDPWHSSEPGEEGVLEDVSALVATEKEPFALADDPEVATAGGQTHVFARGTNRNLLHFVRSSQGTWSAHDVTTQVAREAPIGDIDRYFFDSPFVLSDPSSTDVDLFLVDAFDHLIHFSFYGSSVWAEDVTDEVGNEFRIAHPVVSGKYPIFDVVGLDFQGRLLHFHSAEEGEWTVTDLSAEAGTTTPFEGRPSVVRHPGSDTVTVVARSGTGLKLFYYVAAYENWLALDLGVTVLSDYAIEGDPVAVAPGTSELHIFVTDINDNLLDVRLGPDALEVEDLTASTQGSTMASRPVVSHWGGDRIDVFGRNQFSELVHFYRADTDWSSENVSRLAWTDAFPPPTVEGDPVVVRRRETALDVFAVTATEGQRHFHASAGYAMPWHSADEYSNWAAGDFEYEPRLAAGDDATAQYSWSPLVDERVEMNCGSFDAEATPAHRAGVMVHEATHMLTKRAQHGRWDEHRLGAPEGILMGSDNHGPNQVTVEYWCDQAEFARWDIPPSAYEDAADSANARISSIDEPPDWTCGIPRPL